MPLTLPRTTPRVEKFRQAQTERTRQVRMAARKAPEAAHATQPERGRYNAESARAVRRENAQAFLDELTRTYPDVFSWQSPRPLALGVNRQIRAAHPGVSVGILGLAIWWWTGQRQAAKAVNFGNLYCQRPLGLDRTAWLDYQVHMSVPEAAQALRRFELAYPQLAVWKRHQVAQARQFRQVRTRLGLIRDFDAQGEGYLQGEA